MKINFGFREVKNIFAPIEMVASIKFIAQEEKGILFLKEYLWGGKNFSFSVNREMRKLPIF